MGARGWGCACELITSRLKAAPFPHTSGKSFIMRWHKPCRGLLVARRKEPGWQSGILSPGCIITPGSPQLRRDPLCWGRGRSRGRTAPFGVKSPCLFIELDTTVTFCFPSHENLIQDKWFPRRPTTPKPGGQRSYFGGSRRIGAPRQVHSKFIHRHPTPRSAPLRATTAGKC